MEPLLRLRDVATLLNIGHKPARRWLDKYGVPLIDLGRGRGLGLRWDAADVRDAISRAKSGGQKPAPRQHTPVRGKSFFTGRPVADILKDLEDSTINRQ